LWLPQFGHLILLSLIILSNVSNGVFSVTLALGTVSSINLSARNRCLQSLQSTSGSLNPAKCPLAFQTLGLEIIAESKPTEL
jgi:undecaprenyl pyrophosphate phosphatase UppP